MAELLALKKVRAGIKGSLTRMETFIGANADKFEEISVDELKVRLDTVQGLRTQFMEVEEKMFIVDSDCETQMDEFEAKYYLVAGKLNNWIRKSNSNEQSAGRFEESVLNVTQPQSAEIKLKKLSIPTFSGEYTEWPSFYDLYDTSIHSKDYPAVQKFQYLKSLLTGEAAQLIRYFSVTEANYYEAFSKLVERYDRKKYIVNAFIRTFMDQPSINQVNSSSIRKLRDTSDELLRGLKALDARAETRDSWLIYILIKKLDQETKMLWAQESTSVEYPTTKEFFDFLNKRCDALESMSSYTKIKPAHTRALVTEAKSSTETTWSCPVCKNDTHLLYECSEFMKMSLAGRKGIITADKRCYNCLHKGHNVYDCRARKRCKLCQRKNHSLLHEDVKRATANNVSSHVTQDEKQESKPSTSEPRATCYQTGMLYSMQAILPTALVRVKDSNGIFKVCRALLDSASQVTFITSACVQKLGLKTANGNVMVSGLGQSNLGRTKGIAELEIVSRSKEEFKIRVQAYVVPKITTLQTSSRISCADLNKLKSLCLADPKFNENGHIDLLLGVEVFFSVIESKQLKLSPLLSAQETKFGWVIGGYISETENRNEAVNFNVTVEVDNALRRFWEVENLPTTNELTEEEKYCEEWFKTSTERNKDGRFLVKLPTRGNLSNLGSNYVLAEQRLKSMENRFRRNPEFQKQYVNFMKEYEQLGHMRQINKVINKSEYFLPHHGVLKETSTTTKLRDASSKDVNGTSLNNLLMIGPTIQSPLMDILIRFRRHRYVISGDVEKMYRQVWINQDEANLQKILWRKDPNEPIRQYALNTLTYGTAPASFIATRCLMQMAQDHQKEYPAAAAAIQKDMYVDDLMTGANDEIQLTQLRVDIVNILAEYGFNLRKWATNSAVTREQLADQNSSHEISITEDGTIKVLGLKWNPNLDAFCFSVCLEDRVNHSKRTLLSEASKIFDPLGWLSPLTVRVKIIFQSLWLKNLKWDDQLPDDVCRKWSALRKELKEVRN